MKSTRRLFLKRAAGTAAVIGCPALLGGCGGAEGPSGPIPAGNLADYAEGDLVALVGEGVAIGLDADGLYAVSTICTHAGCDIGSKGTVSGNGMVCDCHGSTFDANGGVTGGPAKEDLEHFAVELDDAGEITIDADTVVGASERTAVA